MAPIRRDSSNGDNTNRRSAFSIDKSTNLKELADTKETLNAEMDARTKSAAISETIPENALETPAQTPALELEKKLEVKSNGTPVNGKPVAGKTSAVSTAPNGQTLKPAPVLISKNKGMNGTSTKSPRSTGPAPVKTPSSDKPAAKPATSATKTKPIPAAISTNKTISSAKSSPKPSPKPAKPPAPPKTPTTPKAVVQKKSPSRATGPTAASKALQTPEKKPTSNASHKTPNKSPAATKTKEGSPSGFVKPKPKSPTKPVRLPASLTAPTASSRSKTSSTTAPPPVARTLSRAQSRASIAPSTSSGLRRSQSTTVRKSAIGPPPAKRESSRPSIGGATNGRPQSAHGHARPSEGFMARMMRPTASSQSKTSDKPPTTPPRKSKPIKRPARKSISRPSTKDSTSVQKPFEGSPIVSKAQKPSSIQLPQSKITAPSDPVEAAPKAEDLTAIAEPVPDTAAEAVMIATSPIEAKAHSLPTEENTRVGDMTECAPKSEITPIAEEPATPTKAEVKEPEAETAPEVSSSKPELTASEIPPTTAQVEEAVAAAPAEVIEDPSKALEDTAGGNAEAGDVTVTETEVEPVVEKEEEIPNAEGVVGETF